MQKHFKKAALATAIAGSLLAGTSAQATEVFGGDLSANVAVVSNYYFRGVSQTDDGPAVQGGVDLEGIGGTSIYVGTWASNVDFGDRANEEVTNTDGDTIEVQTGVNNSTSYEIDFYAGWAPSLGDFNFDVGYIYYAYPDTPGADIDYGELYGSAGWKWFTVGVSYTVNSDNDEGPFQEKDLYGFLAADVELQDGWGIGASVGGYKFDDDGERDSDGVEQDLDYANWNIYVSKDVGDWGAFNLTYEQTDIDDDNTFFGTTNADDPKVWVGWSKGF
jgi:uncharacterized protein (TIGR02001 family)